MVFLNKFFIKFQKFLVAQPKISKELKPGRVVIISQGKHYNKLAILLLVKNVVTKNTVYKVLVLDHQFKPTAEQVGILKCCVQILSFIWTGRFYFSKFIFQSSGF